MKSTTKKRGRKPKPYVCPWDNTTIDGLYLCPDGRWRNIATGKKFTEADPRQAVVRFRREQAREQGTSISIPLPFPPQHADPDVAGAVEWLLRRELAPGHHHATGDDTLLLHVPAKFDPIGLMRAIPEEAYYAHVAQDIMTRPKYVAERTGIEQIGYLTSLSRPKPSPSLKELGDHYFTTKRVQANWMSKCRSFWAEFCEVVQAENLRAVEQEMVTAYKDSVEDRQKEGGFPNTPSS